MFRKYYQYEKIDKTSRTIVEKIPEKAFREAIANALVHRLWDLNAYIKISMFSDRVEITSSGGLLSGLSVDEYLNGQISLLRNHIIGNLFYRLRYIEKSETGIIRIQSAYEHSSNKPEYKVFDNLITIGLPIILSTKVLSNDELKVIEALKSNLKLSNQKLRRKLG